MTTFAEIVNNDPVTLDQYFLFSLDADEEKTIRYFCTSIGGGAFMLSESYRATLFDSITEASAAIDRFFRTFEQFPGFTPRLDSIVKRDWFIGRRQAFTTYTTGVTGGLFVARHGLQSIDA